MILWLQLNTKKIGSAPENTYILLDSLVWDIFMSHAVFWLVCYTAVFSVVTQRSSGGALRDDPKNGGVADYILASLQGETKYRRRVKISHDTTH